MSQHLVVDIRGIERMMQPGEQHHFFSSSESGYRRASTQMCIERPHFATIKTSIPASNTKITPVHLSAKPLKKRQGSRPIVEEMPMPTESIIGTMAALLAAPKRYCIKYLDAITAVLCAGMASTSILAVFPVSYSATYQHSRCLDY